MAGRTAAWLWGAALAALILFAPGVARSAEVIPPGREAIVLALVQRALDAGEATPDEKLKYDIRIEYDVVRVMLTAPDDVELVVHAQRWVENELAPGVVLKCGSAACSDAQQARWKSSAEALALERDNARDTVWTDVQPTVAPDSPKSQGPPRALWVAVMLFGLGWLVAHSVRCLKEIDWRARRRELLVGASLCLAATLIALALTAALPLHEHNSYVARADCAWSLDCSRDPAGPGWVPGFFKAYGPLLHTFPYGVRNLCRFTLVASLFAALLARQWLIGSLLALGWTPNDARRAGLCALAAMCLNPLWIRVAVAGTPWPYVLVCLFGAGLATAETQRGSRANRLLAGAAATCLLSLAVNSNLVLLTALPLAWLGPSMVRKGTRWWLPSAWQLPAVALLAGLSLEAISIFRAAISQSANPHLEPRAYHLFFDARFLPPALGLLMLVGLVVAARRRSSLWALGYLALVTHPTLTNYAGRTLGTNYPVSLINAFIGETFAAVFVGVGSVWLLRKAAERNRERLALALLGLALLLPLPFARESWRFLTGSRVAERELAAISSVLPRLPRHAQLLLPSRIQPMEGDAKPQGDPLELQFPVGEYLASEHRLGREPKHPVRLDEGDEGKKSLDDVSQTLVYVGVSQRSFFRTEMDSGVVPESLNRSELEALRQRFDFVPVETFELTPAQHEAIPWRLGADRVATVELGFYWLKPKAR